MDPIFLTIAGGLALALLGGLGLWLLRAGRGDRQRLTAHLDEQRRHSLELAGRLAQMAENTSAQQGQLAEALQRQERELAKRLEDRLADLNRRIGDTLTRNQESTQTTMTDLKERLAVIDAAQKNITDLSSQVVGLQDILSNKQARGAFGEIQLNDLVSGVLPPNAYALQASLSNGRRADCLLLLPNPPGAIVIDSKFPLESYRALTEARDDETRATARKQLGADIQTHVKAIAERYILPGETAESALMFLPSEAIYAELHASLPQVVDESFRRRVWIVSPTTMMATLNTVRAVLKDVRMREQAHIIQREMYALLEDIGRLDQRVDKLQSHFGQAEKDLREIRISTDKVAKRGGRIQELDIGDEIGAGALEDGKVMRLADRGGA
ncbi:MAG: DNA recombination protein RmuC [Alphaproteobacteria bacterium]|nr:DNA recombination protein RmuC [Alphaproteobacteria bacterium]